MTKTFNELFAHRDHTPVPSSSWGRRVIRMVYDAVRGFIEDDCYAKASALTYYSLLSVVPILAVLFGIAKGFGFEQTLQKEIIERFSEQKEVMDRLIQFAYSLLHNVKGGIIAGVGTLVLFWSVLGLLNNIENALNAIWKIPVGRPFRRKMSDYLASMLICPIFFVTSSSITVFLSTQIAATAHANVITEALSPVLLFILRLFPYFLSWLLFTFIYLYLPNTTVYLRSAIIAGVIGGTAFQLWQWIYIKFQIGVANYGAVYGSFAALPLFLIWLQVSWIILLAGAELAFEIENDLFIPNRKQVPLSSKAAALLVTFRCIEAFVKGNPPHTDRSLAHELGISLNHLHGVLEALEHGKILSIVSFKKGTIGYQPARTVDSITLARVCEAIDTRSELQASVEESHLLRKIQDYLELNEKAVERSPINQPLYKALVE